MISFDFDNELRDSWKTDADCRSGQYQYYQSTTNVVFVVLPIIKPQNIIYSVIKQSGGMCYTADATY